MRRRLGRFTPEDGYTLVIDPKCIGNPKTLGYSVAIFFDTNPKDENAPMATDRVPDQGFKEVAAPVQPGESPARTPASAGAPTAPAMAPSEPSPPAPVRARRPAATPAPARRHGHRVGVRLRPAIRRPRRPRLAPLARTGSATTQRSLFGLGILLLGAGLVVMTRPTKALAARA